MVISYIGLGSNAGDRRKNIDDACHKIANIQKLKILKRSPLYLTSPIGPKQRNFINGVLKIKTSLAPRELLANFKFIEHELGRKKSRRWGPRKIDIDILFYGRDVLKKKGLNIPHVELANRLFVLAPLGDIAPNLRDPVLKKTVSVMKKELLLISPEQKVKILKTVKR